jgi:hypothetical protein
MLDEWRPISVGSPFVLWDERYFAKVSEKRMRLAAPAANFCDGRLF